MKKSYKLIAISVVSSVLLAGCGDQNFSGSITKGPIDKAGITLVNDKGDVVSGIESYKGKFDFHVGDLTDTFYTLESHGGSYEDEATGEKVGLGFTDSLKTFFTQEELSTIIADEKNVSITPESTLFALLVTKFIKEDGKTLKIAMMQGKMLVTSTMIKKSQPMPSLKDDIFTREGDLSVAVPASGVEAFAQNRTIAFSYMLKDLGLAPDRAVEVINAIFEDLKDGVEDGITIDGKEINEGEAFAVARFKLFNELTTKLFNGELGEVNVKRLMLMGVNVMDYNNALAKENMKQQMEINKYINSGMLPSLHILPTMEDEDGNANDDKATYTLTASDNVDVEIQTPMGSWITPMMRYNNSALPLIIRTDRGDAMTLNFNNHLEEDSTIHWHGFKIPADMDGGPDVPIAADTTKVYSFTMNQPAAPLWFHPHPDMDTGKQVYMGLAGVYLLEDDISKGLESSNQLPSGEKDTTLLIQDRRFGPEVEGVRELMYKNMSVDSDGIMGDKMLVNGSVMPKQEVSNTQHRFRLYNVANARTFDFALSDGSEFTIIGTDGGLLKNPIKVKHVLLGAAERAEIVVDFSKYEVGDKVMLVSKPFMGDMMGMFGMDMENDTNSTDTMSTMDMDGGMPENGAALSIMRFDITKDEIDIVQLYTQLPQNAEISIRHSELSVTNNQERPFLMSLDMGGMDDMANMDSNDSMAGGMDMRFAINYKIYDITRVDEFIEAGATEIWNITNMSVMAHPFHAHAIQYQILDRDGVKASGVDLGWKDTFLVQPGESVRVIGRFEAVNTGDYMYHCHILEHEDAGMMGVFRVGDTGVLGPQ